MSILITAVVAIALMALLVFLICYAFNMRNVWYGFLTFLGSLLGVGFCLLFWLFHLSPYAREEWDRIKAQDKLDAVPRVVQEFDNCKVWAFKNDRWIYNTVCK